MNLTAALRRRPPKVGPPICTVSLMYCDNGVMRFLRSAGGPAVFGPAAETGTYTLKFTFRQELDPGFRGYDPLYPVIWRKYDDGRMFQQIALKPVHMNSYIWDGWNVVIDMDVHLDKRAWKLRCER